MTKITFKGNPVETVGNLPAVGGNAPGFTLTNTELADVSLKDFSGKNIVLNIFPSLDTPVCAMSVRQFNQEATQRKDTVVLCISADLPFAQQRFCGAEGLNDVVPLSDFRHKEFGDVYGVRITTGPLAGLLSRAVLVLNTSGKVTYTEQVPEIAEEPNYDAAMAAVSKQ
jgi:thiol peroxidase